MDSQAHATLAASAAAWHDVLLVTVLLVLCLLVVLVVLRSVRRAGRSVELSRVAAELLLHCRFDEAPDKLEKRAADLNRFALFRESAYAVARISNLMVGKAGKATVEIFDAETHLLDRLKRRDPGATRGEDGTLDMPEASRQTVVLFADERLHLPRFVLAPDGDLLRRIEGRPAPDESADDFDRHNRIRSEEPDLAAALFAGKARQLLAANRDVTIEADAHRLMLYRPERLMTAKAIKALYETGTSLLAQFRELQP
jgi:hypothetical protein